MSLTIKSQCPNNNQYAGNVNIICPDEVTSLCIQGGQYITMNVIAGNTYTINTCGATWDTQITLYNGMTYLAYNDDFCGLQSNVNWTATYSGTLTIVLDQYFCASTTSCAFINISCCNPSIPNNEDCLGATLICSNNSFNSNSNGLGCTVDLNSGNYGCLLSAERQGTWYTFSPINSGTLAFSINPLDPFDDYDFAIWGPYPPGSYNSTICPIVGQPLRCSYSALGGSTGLSFTAPDLTEGAGGDKWVRHIDAVANNVYVLYISNFSQSGLAFNLTWNTNNTAILDCTPLPINVVYFIGHYDRYNIIQWSADKGANLHRSEDLSRWIGLGVHDGVYIDKTFNNTVNYYRLFFDGDFSDIIAIDNTNSLQITKITNVLGQEVNENYRGVVIEHYNNDAFKSLRKL
jgi:hypothetical protein